jgi:hypothetical protein
MSRRRILIVFGGHGSVVNVKLTAFDDDDDDRIRALLVKQPSRKETSA